MNFIKVLKVYELNLFMDLINIWTNQQLQSKPTC